MPVAHCQVTGKMSGGRRLKEAKMAKARNWLECTSCDAMFTVKHTMDEKFYSPEYCPFCGEELELEEQLEITYEEEEDV